MVQTSTERATGRDKGAYSANGGGREGSCQAVHGRVSSAGKKLRGGLGVVAQGLGEVCRSSWRGKTGNGEGVRADLVRRRKRPGRLGFCSWGPTEGGEGLWRCGSV